MLGSIVCNTYNNPYTYNNTYPTNIYLYVESGTRCYAKPNKDFEFSSWVQNLPHNSTITLNTTSMSDSPWVSILRLIGFTPNDPSVTFTVNGYGTFTANFKPLPPPVPPAYWASLFTIVVTALVGSLLIPAGIEWFKSKRQISRLNSFHRNMIKLYDNGKIDERGTQQLNTLNNKLISAYSEGKINNELYTNLKSQISILYEEIYEKKIKSLISKDSILNTPNVILMDELKSDVIDAYAKGKITEQHYKILNEKISNSTNNQRASTASRPTAQGSPIRS
jgi:hypothetical protein